MDDFTLTLIRNRQAYPIPADSHRDLLHLIRAAGHSLSADCAGIGRCGKCLVSVSGPVYDAGGQLHHLDGQSILACRHRPAGPCTVILPEADALQVLTAAREPIPADAEGLGAAVDIGTTTLAVSLYDLATGQLLGSRGQRSAQRPYGADVISRIRHCARTEGLQQLQAVISDQIGDLLQSLCCEAGAALSDIRALSIAGNTVMEHIFAGLDPTGIGVAPFRPQSLFGYNSPARELLAGLSPGARLYLCPAVAGYVGGDITAGLLAAGADRTEELTLFLDIGTNGEMALGDKNGWLCCATAAGPAFEGAEIACGMGGAPGAIDRVWYDGSTVRFHVIGGSEARGLCGSGLLDAAAALLDAGLLLPNGRLDGTDAPGPLAAALRRNAQGELCYYFTDAVWLSASDIRALQLAKAAIRAGAETLLEQKGRRADDIRHCLIAGGFGAYMRVESACALGLLPACLQDKARHIGNAAVRGAALSLTGDGLARLESIAARCQYYELSGSAVFNENYLEAMAFDGPEE